ncbi:hypothetical protein A8924_0337 [Saccharopolyspora erythraea NRRL 2338]|uniref:Uncharacterized protein n=2 Tax=Saccharopolyspora erythraea TaxID=1836 RepID=A4FR33_SACEN|nr:hypothetical protein [Saccharopolyspora erythraea]EQD83930.1 hypothetical protein N599_22745 [Saccharopolyspora erythraea D]PFG93109.1 hypothetical protein A8924_0337 [Saccharopolyspora erythraea NRRL 2338]QRK89978.1 hypothetical protein JQX30_36790 [Saccharopolyspora erythraea]CAM06508.1 hypothetical protein SACE_7352 [Saccharopolyspora erythraea NRRL 2338]
MGEGSAPDARGCDGRPNPLVRRARRGAAAGLVGLAITASTFLGAGTAAAADTLVVDRSLAVVDAVVGQSVALSPSTMDLKVREAVLLAMPLDFGAAADAVERFRELPPIPLGTAGEGRTFYSGGDIARAAKPRIAQLGLPEDKVDAVSWHFGNLVSIGNAVTVNAEAPEEPPPPPPPAPAPDPQPAPPPPQTVPSETPTSDDVQAPPPGAPLPPEAYAAQGAAAPYRAVPGNYSYVPGSLPPWARYGQVPGFTPDVGTLTRPWAEQQQKQREQEQVRAVGNAEALPTTGGDRVALPVLLAAVSIAGLTAALVRTWVLRRQ